MLFGPFTDDFHACAFELDLGHVVILVERLQIGVRIPVAVGRTHVALATQVELLLGRREKLILLAHHDIG